jgi:hypothetical protein
MSREQVDTHFADDVLHALERSGWTEARRVTATLWIAALERDGNRAFPLARDFLERFGGLVLDARPRPDRAFNPGRTLLDPVRAAVGEHDRIAGWQADHGLVLFPVGYAFDDYAILMITPDEAFYAGTDTQLLRLGKGTPACLRMLLFAPTKPEVIADDLAG